MELLCIIGPTGVGKTAVAIELARRHNGEIVSCDSMQVYRRMDIGTAKATKAERDSVPHHLLDIVEPEEAYSAARYARDADAAIGGIIARGCLPIVTGGTGLYLKALLYGLHGVGPDDGGAARALWQRFGQEQGLQGLYDELSKVDPASARRIGAGDARRLVRALEVYTLTGVPLSRHHELSQQAKPRYEARVAGLYFAERQALYDRIDRRVADMRARGLENEVRALLESGIPPEATSMQAIGYKELSAVVRSGGDMDGAFAQIALNTRRYAKRQMTFFRALDGVRWIDVSGKEIVGISTEIEENNGLPTLM